MRNVGHSSVISCISIESGVLAEMCSSPGKSPLGVLPLQQPAILEKIAISPPSTMGGGASPITLGLAILLYFEAVASKGKKGQAGSF